MKNYKWKKHWYLGFLGFIGFYELPYILSYFNGNESVWILLGLLWFLWFDYFVPTKTMNKGSYMDFDSSNVSIIKFVKDSISKNLKNHFKSQFL